MGEFELRLMSPEAPGRTNGTRGQGGPTPSMAIGTHSSCKKGIADETIVLTGDEPHEWYEVWRHLCRSVD
jgi:hypothetical protein